MKKHIHFYFDPVSPYVYLAWTQLTPFLEETGAVLQVIPVLFAGLLNAHGQKGPAEIPAKRIYTFKDVIRWAYRYGIPMEFPSKHPFNPLSSLRVCIALENEKDRQQWVGRILKACWVEGKDLSDASVLLDLVNELGFDSEKILQKSQSVEVKEQLKKNTDEAIQTGVFGVPTFRVEGEIFWGNDRLSFVKDFLRGEGPVASHKLEKFLKLPRGADRKL